MSPDFAAAVDPVFSYVLDLLERIEQGEVVPEDERDAILDMFGRAAAKLSSCQDWELAKYALACWIDDVLLNAPWMGVVYWNDHKIETKLFQSNNRAVDFFERAKEASQQVDKDALEVFYLCVVLGFRGIYNEGPTIDESSSMRNDATLAGNNRRQQIAELATSYQLPATITAWVEQTASAIHAQPKVTDLRGEGYPPGSNEPRSAQAWLIGVYMVVALLGAFALIAISLKDRLSAF